MKMKAALLILAIGIGLYALRADCAYCGGLICMSSADCFDGCACFGPIGQPGRCASVVD